MVTSKQIAKGVGLFVDNEVLPMLSGGTRYGVSVGSVMGAKWLEGKLEHLRKTEAAKELGLSVGDGFELETLRTAMVERFPDEGIRIEADRINRFINHFLGKLGPVLNIQMEGGLTFYRADLEKVFRYIGRE